MASRSRWSTLYRAKRGYRQIVFATHLAGGAHTIVIRVLGTHADASTASRVDIDALLMMQGGTDATPTSARAAGHGRR